MAALATLPPIFFSALFDSNTTAGSVYFHVPTSSSAVATLFLSKIVDRAEATLLPEPPAMPERIPPRIFCEEPDVVSS